MNLLGYILKKKSRLVLIISLFVLFLTSQPSNVLAASVSGNFGGWHYGEWRYYGCGYGTSINAGSPLQATSNGYTVIFSDNYARGLYDDKITTGNEVRWGTGCSQNQPYGNTFVVKYKGTFNFDTAGTYQFGGNSDDGLLVTLDGPDGNPSTNPIGGTVLINRDFGGDFNSEPSALHVYNTTAGLGSLSVEGPQVNISAGSHVIHVYVKNGGGSIGGGCCAMGGWVGWKLITTAPPVNHPPSVFNMYLFDVDGARYNPPTVSADGQHSYRVDIYTSDSEGGGDINYVYGLINYQGSNAGNYRGHFGWSTSNYFTYWDNGYAYKDLVGCSGGGNAALYNGVWGGGAGSQYIDVTGCSTSTFNWDGYQGRLVSIYIKFNPNFTSPTSGNTISAWAMDAAGGQSPWAPFYNFGLNPPIGTLTVNTTPVSGGVYVNGSYWGNATQSRSLSPGTYTVTFGAVTNYNTPAAQSCTVYSNQTATCTGTYTSQNGTLTVTTTPVSGGVYVNGGYWGGATQSRSLSPGTYTVSFGGVTNYNTPGNQSCTVYSNQTTTCTGTYTIQNGTLTVNTTPVSGAIYVDGSYVGTGSWSGARTPGGHTVSFGGVANYNTPAPQSVTVNANQTTTVTGTYSVQNGTLTVNTTPVSGGVTVNGTYWGIAPQSWAAAPPGTYTVTFSPVTNYNTPGNQSCTVYSNQTTTCTGTYTAQNGTLTVNSSPSGAPFTYTGPSSGSGTTPANISLSPGAYTVSFGAVSGYLLTGTNPSPPTGNVTSNATVTVAGNYTATSTVAINMINDANANGVIDWGEGVVTGKALQVSCVTTSSVPCPGNPIDVWGSASYPLDQGGTYTFGYNQMSAANDPYKLLTQVFVNGSPQANPAGIIPGVWGGRVDFLVSKNTPAWIQVWDGDVYSGQSINIHVNSLAASPHNDIISFDMATGTNTAGGLVRSVWTSDCNGFPCSEKGWLMASSGSLDFPTSLFNLIDATDPDVQILSDGTTVTSQAAFAGKKVILVRGNVIINAAEAALGESDDLTGFIVATGNMTINGSGANELVIKGGLIAGGQFIFNLSLNDNKHSLLTAKYNPVLLTNLSSTSRLALPTFTWREVAAN